MAILSSRGWQRLIFVSVVALVAAGLLLPWCRNHTSLRDFYDYGNVMSAVGRIEMGDRPYVDFMTPIQTLQFYQAVLTERLLGAQYLSLTYGNAVFIVVSLVAFVLLLARPLGKWTALLVAAGVVAGTSVQHTIVWYNAMGVAWVAGVVWLTPRLGATSCARAAGWTAVGLLLWLGGMTKVTYQVTALAFVLLFTLRLAFRREISWKRAMGLGGGCLMAGVVLPVVTEMLLTGATFAQWKHNVLGLASSRTALLQAIATVGFYLKTPHYYYEPMYLPWVGAWGVALLAITAFFTWRCLGRQYPPVVEKLFFGLTVLGVAVCGVVLLAAHYEIAYFSGALWLVLAAGMVAAFVPRDAAGTGRLARVGLGVGAASLLATAWPSAWSGARSLYGDGRLVRETMVTADDLPVRYDYLHGLRITLQEHRALVAFAGYHDALLSEGVPAQAFYFIHATDWMVRAMPDARQRGLPLWLQYGTTFSDADASVVMGRLQRRTDIQVIVSHRSWNAWFLGMEDKMNERFRRQLIGGLFYAYRLPREVARPLDYSTRFAEAVNTNLAVKQMVLSGGPVELLAGPDGTFVGSARSHRVAFKFGLFRLSGEMVAQREVDDPSPETEVIFRIRLDEGEGMGSLLWNETMVLTPKVTSLVHKFLVSPGGQRVALEVELPPGEKASAGWRSLRTDHAGPLGREVPGPINGNHTTAPLAQAVETWRTAALFAPDSPRTAAVHAFGAGAAPGGRGLVLGAPGEIWMCFDKPATRVTGEYEMLTSAGNGTGPPQGVRIALMYYKGGRLETLVVRDVLAQAPTVDGPPQTFEVGVPDTVGWIGLIVAPLENFDESTSRVRWSNLRIQ